MNYWLHDLPIVWMAVVIFGATYIVAAAIYVAVVVSAKGKSGRSFKAVSAGMLPTLGILFGLFVAFTAAQVWSDNNQATSAVDHEASALRAAVILAAAFPGEPQARLDALIRSHIQSVTTVEWERMEHRRVTLSSLPHNLAVALQFTLSLTPSNAGQVTAQRELVHAIETALDARRQRILISQWEVHPVKWACLIAQALCALLAIALVHSDDRLAGALTVGIFATGVAACLLLIASYDRPFVGELRVGPQPLIEIMPKAPAVTQNPIIK